MSDADQSGAGRREVAYRIFATEFNDANYSFSESEEERAPSYVVTPTGARANRLFLVGVLTEIEQVSENVLRARVVDPTGAFVLYAGQYQPDEQAFLEQTEPPTFVAVTGKARTFTPEDSEQVFTSIRPESISEVDAETRDRWTVQAAKHTTQRIGWMAQALSLNTGEGLRAMLVERGADDGLAHGIELAIDRYGTTPTYLDALREMALDAVRVVAGERDEIAGTSLAPDATGDVTVDALAQKVAVDLEEPATTAGSDSISTTDEQTAQTVSAGEQTEETVSAGAEGDDKTTGDETAPAQTERESETTGSEDVSTATSPESAQPESQQTVETGGETTTEPNTVDASPVEAETDDSSVDESAEEELGDFDPEEFELEEETRTEVEEEYGTEFQTGTEVDEPGEAGIETPEEVADEPPTSDLEAVSEPDTSTTGSGTNEAPDQQETISETAGDTDTETVDDGDSEPADGSDTEQPDDLQAAVVELMGELDAGDGADREDLIAEMDARYGTERETVESAIQDALMDGQCYEPDDSLLKPI